MKLRTLDDIYAAIPNVECRGLCSDQCTIIGVFPIEADSMKSKNLAVPSFDESTQRCANLRGNRCQIYADRPTICRFWGVVGKMKCPHGCKVDKMLTPREEREIFAALFRLSGSKGARIFSRPKTAIEL